MGARRATTDVTNHDLDSKRQQARAPNAASGLAAGQLEREHVRSVLQHLFLCRRLLHYPPRSAVTYNSAFPGRFSNSHKILPPAHKTWYEACPPSCAHHGRARRPLCPPYPPQVRQIEETKAIGRDTLVELDNQAIAPWRAHAAGETKSVRAALKLLKPQFRLRRL